MKYAGWIVAAAVVLLALTQGRQTAGPMEPVVVAGAASFPALATGGNSLRESEIALVLRFWSDGAVDATTVYSARRDDDCSNAVEPDLCTGPTTLIPGTCMADVDRNGFVETPDLLELLAGWGPCEE